MTTEEPAEPLELTSEERELVLERRKRIADKLPIAKRFRVLRRWVENREAHGYTLEQIAAEVAASYKVPAPAKVTKEVDTHVVLVFEGTA